jgi:phenylpropionate dioxygenase-like ring-hydroxylating dioxygenase large terminal subunit
MLATIVILLLMFISWCDAFIIPSAIRRPTVQLFKRSLNSNLNTNMDSEYEKSLPLPLESIYRQGFGAWVPMGSISSFDTKYPIALEVLGEKYVIWKAPGGNMSEGWSVMRDMCPHRLAPLSEGRVDAVSGCLECPYHGWQFNTQGACTKIPQQDPKQKSLPLVNTASRAFETKVLGDMLFSYLPVPGQKYRDVTSPEQIFPLLPQIKSFTVRELPYSFDFLVENFMDPAHIPFAHHSLQTTRDEARHIPINLLTSLDDGSAIEMSFEDIKRKKEVRQGIMSFKPPFYYYLRTKPSSMKPPKHGKPLSRNSRLYIQ